MTSIMSHSRIVGLAEPQCNFAHLIPPAICPALPRAGKMRGMTIESKSPARRRSDTLLLLAALTIAIIAGFVIARLLWGGPIPRLF